MFNEYNYNSIFGYQLIGVPHMAEKVQARTHKKTRINKKWRKRYGFREVPWKTFYVSGDTIYGHPTMIDKIKMDMAFKR
jgi:hypothetical protein